MNFLLDTNVISALRRRRDERVRQWAAANRTSQFYISSLTIGEIRKGVEQLRPRGPAQAEVFETWLTGLYGEFEDRILAPDGRAAEQWGRLEATRSRNTVDALIAASAKVHGLTVATRNVSDFKDCGVAVINPWEHPLPPDAEA